ncbi:hypothetical protein FO519_000993 [Halicephalobus sp. NKZ332]|nr:hypothetical protein FO519_000993 [Halicephalobus sp. NKZ332]
MERIRRFGTTIYTHKKKFIFASLVAAYGIDYARLSIRDSDIRTFYAKQAVKYGEQTISPEISPRKITVLVNKSANSGSGVSDFKKNALPLLHLAGIAVTIINVESAEQMRALCSVLDHTEADGVLVVGGDGTASDALTGLVQRKDELPSLPIGIFPGGKCNKSLRLLVPAVFRQTSDVRYQCESAMAVVENSTRSVKPIKVEITSLVEPEEKDEEAPEEKPQGTPAEVKEPEKPEISADIQQWKVETVYTIGDIADGWFNYIDEKKWKFWYWGSLKRRFAYFWEMLKNSPKEIRAEIELTDYCSGCNKCRTTKVSPPPAWRWWHILIGSPKTQRINPKEKNYSQVVNEGCGRKTEMCAQGTDIVVVGEQHEDACSLRLRVGGTFAGRLGIMRNGWTRTSEDFIISSATPGFYGIDLVASSVTMKFIECPTTLEKLFVSGNIKDFKSGTSTVKIQPIEKSIELFLPKHTRVNLDAF